MKNKRKITITNAYTWFNKGDAGILLGIVDTLKKQYGADNIEINILSFTPEVDKEHYCIDSCINNVYSNTLNPHPYKHTKLGKIWAIIKLFFRMIYLYIMTQIFFERIVKKEESLSVLKDSDLIVVCGGGFLGGKKYDSLMHVFQIYLDTLFKKPVIVMGTSIEPIKKRIIKKYTEKILKKVNYVYARETITYNYLKTFMEADKIALIPDMAFMLDINEEYKNEEILKLKKESEYIIGITVRKWNFPNLSSSAKAMDIYKKAVADTMEKLITQHNAYFVFVPQVTVDTGDDTIVANEIKDILDDKLKSHFIILNDDLSPTEIKKLISYFDFFIGTRMHSNIFATSVFVPTVAIAYEKKTNGIMETVGLDDYIVEIDSISNDLLTQKVFEIINNKDNIQKNLNVKIPIIKKEIMKKIKFVMKEY